MNRVLYFDWNASTPILPVAKQAISDAIEYIGNPSSAHSPGCAVREKVEQARDAVADLVAIDDVQIIFTSGATEAINQCIMSGWRHICLGATEHPAVHASAKASGAHLHNIPVTQAGIADLSVLADTLQHLAGDGPILVALMAVNNETGILHPLAEALEVVHSHAAFMLVDAAQAAGRMDLRKLWGEDSPDYVAMSAHKMGAPAGVGALARKQSTPLKSLLHGGGQESMLRAGTENIIGTLAFGAVAASHDYTSWSKCAPLIAQIRSEIAEIAPEAVFFAEHSARQPNICCFAIPEWNSQSLLAALDMQGVAASSGSACSSGTLSPSHVLTAMGYESDIAKCSVRLSIGPTTSMEDIKGFSDVWRRIYASNRKAQKVA